MPTPACRRRSSRSWPARPRRSRMSGTASPWFAPPSLPVRVGLTGGSPSPCALRSPQWTGRRGPLPGNLRRNRRLRPPSLTQVRPRVTGGSPAPIVPKFGQTGPKLDVDFDVSRETFREHCSAAVWPRRRGKSLSDVQDPSLGRIKTGDRLGTEFVQPGRHARLGRHEAGVLRHQHHPVLEVAPAAVVQASRRVDQTE